MDEGCPGRAAAGPWAEGLEVMAVMGRGLSPGPGRGGIQLTEESGQIGLQVQREQAVLRGHVATYQT